MVTLKMIGKLDIFKDFTDSELEAILGLCSIEEYQEGDRLFTEGDAATDMWIVKDGEVDLRFEMPNAKPATNESTLSSHKKDDPESQVFGWSCFIAPNKMRLSAYCVSRRCEVIKINSTPLNKLMQSDTQIGYKIMKYVVQVLGYRFKQIQNELAKNVGIEMMNSW